MAKRHRIIGTTPAAIEAFELKIARSLPESFKAWLLEHNGSGWVFPVPDDNEPRTLTGNLLDEREKLASYAASCLDAAPATVDHLLPVAAVGDGDLWCLDLDLLGIDGEAQVVRWSHETGETWTVAKDFTAFLAVRDAGELED